MSKSLYPALLIACVYAAQSISAVPTEEFYAEGTDPLTGGEDDHTFLIPLDPALPFYGKSYNGCVVHTNGIVIFNNENITESLRYTNDPFPLDGYKFIAPFYGDVDTLSAGTISYTKQPLNLSNDEQALNETRNDISTAFPDYDNFIPKYLIIATWNDVGYYNNNSDKTNTFQCIIATDGTMSFSIFLYNKTEWTTQDDINNMTLNAMATPAKVGFNAGSQNKSWEIPCSGTCLITHLPTTSNVGRPGVWVFRIDQEDISPACPPHDEHNQSCYDEVLCSNGQWCLTGRLTYAFKCGCHTCWEDDNEMCMESTSPSPSPTPSGPGCNATNTALLAWGIGVTAALGLSVVVIVILTLIIYYKVCKHCKRGQQGQQLQEPEEQEDKL